MSDAWGEIRQIKDNDEVWTVSILTAVGKIKEVLTNQTASSLHRSLFSCSLTPAPSLSLNLTKFSSGRTGAQLETKWISSLRAGAAFETRQQLLVSLSFPFGLADSPPPLHTSTNLSHIVTDKGGTSAHQTLTVIEG